MKKLFTAFLAEATAAAILTAVLLNTITVFAWGDNSGGRKSYTKAQIDEGILGDNIIFNTISDGTVGNEKNFVAAREAGKNEGIKNVWNANDITVENGKEYLIRIYVHNNNPRGYDAVAENTRVSFSIPSVSQKTVEVNGFISSSNAAPSEYWDYINFHSEVPFHLEYVYGSALLENNGIGKGIGLKLSDDVVMAASGGTLIGYDALDGKIPGCYQYTSVVTIEVKAVYDYEYTVQQNVRLVDDKNRDWKDAIEAKIGDKVEFLVGYQNTGTVKQEDVTIKDILPDNLRYIEGSAKIMNPAFPDDTLVAEDNIFNEGIKLGNFDSGESISITFMAEVIDKNLNKGTNSLINWGQVCVGSTMLQEHTAIVAYKNTALYAITIKILSVVIFVCIVCIVICNIIKKQRKI